MVKKTTKKKSLLERLRTRDVRNGESGLALLDVLIGMAIFALIALIALSSLSQYRQKAYLSGAQSDAKAIGTAIEAESITTGTYPVCVKENGTEYQPFSGGTAANATTTEGACTGTGTAVNTSLGKVTKNNHVVGYRQYTITGTGPTANRLAFKFCVEHWSGTASTSADAWAVYESEKGGLTSSGTGDGCNAGAGTDANWILTTG